MYKTITHKTTEEHYIDGKLVMPMPMPMPEPEPMPMISEALPTVVINEQTMLFRMDNRTLWTRYSLGMINFSVASFGRLASAEVVAGNLKKSAAACGEYFTPYYGLTATRKISSLFSVIAINGERIVDSLQAGRDIAAFETIWDKQIDELAKYLNELNPQYWPKDTLVDMFINLTGFWVDDFRARLAKDFVADSIALDNILKVAVSGIPNHTKKGFASIADLISKGIILQSPLAFTE
jgi:hypothetical protein